MSSLIFASRFAANAVGHGGNHRSYQVLNDLRQAAGAEHVFVYDPVPEPDMRPAGHVPGRFTLRERLYLLLRFAQYRGNPYRTLAFILSGAFRHRRAYGTFSAAHYEAFLQQVPQASLCVIDHPRMAALIEVNRRHGIVTVACPHNLEAFDLAEELPAGEWERYAFMADFVAEQGILEACHERLFISRVEAGLVGGLGLSCHYYPYLPQDAIRERGMRLRRQREAQACEPGLFVILGSAAHGTTREGFEWFTQNVLASGLPAGVRVVIAGLETDTLLAPGTTVAGIDLRGWLDQESLDNLICRAQAVLVPQRRGFGALTRLPELACAGVPVYTSAHASLALDLPPGIHSLPDDWQAWKQLLQGQHLSPGHLPVSAYEKWETAQPQPIGSIIRRYVQS